MSDGWVIRKHESSAVDLVTVSFYCVLYSKFFGLISSFGGLFLTSKSSSDYKSYHDGQ